MMFQFIDLKDISTKKGIAIDKLEFGGLQSLFILLLYVRLKCVFGDDTCLIISEVQ